MRGAAIASKLAAGLAVGLVCLWLAVRHVDGPALGTALSHFDPRYLVPAVGVSLLLQLLRAWRWQIELRPLARLRFALLWQVVAVAYMMINLLPFRLGEPVRPLLLSWRTRLTVASIVGNWVFEKMMDAAALVFYVHVTLLVTDLPSWALRASVVSLTVFALLAAIVVGFWLRGDAFFDATAGRLLPRAARHWTRGILSSAREGLKILPDAGLVAAVFVVTLLLWSLPILSSYLIIAGFGFDVPLAAAFAVFVAISAGTALPNPPGMIGVFQIAAVVALGLFGVAQADALAFGILLNAVQLITLVAQGLIALPFTGVRLGKLTQAAVQG